MCLGGSERSELEPSHMRNSLEMAGTSSSPIRFMTTLIWRHKMAHRKHGNAFDDAMELLIENGFDSMADVLRMLLNALIKSRDEDPDGEDYVTEVGLLDALHKDSTKTGRTIF